jgi:hypothetical protein
MDEWMVCIAKKWKKERKKHSAANKIQGRGIEERIFGIKISCFLPVRYLIYQKKIDTRFRKIMMNFGTKRVKTDYHPKSSTSQSRTTSIQCSLGHLTSL